jgi:hypothetical protein
MITTIIVTSKDGVPFSVSFEARPQAAARMAEVAEARFAATRTAAQLESFGDYHRVDPVSGFVAAPKFKGYDLKFAQAPRIAGPQERRAAFTLIRGGKP